MRRIVSLLAICAALVSCGNTGGKSTGDEFQSINWRDNDAAAVICVGMYTKESDLRDSWLLERYSKSYGLENLETVQTKGDEWSRSTRTATSIRACCSPRGTGGLSC